MTAAIPQVPVPTAILELKEFKQSCLEMIEKCQSYMNSDDCTNYKLVKETKSKLEQIIVN